jgi:hypothetical protein
VIKTKLTLITVSLLLTLTATTTVFGTNDAIEQPEVTDELESVRYDKLMNQQKMKQKSLKLLNQSQI